MCKQYDMQVLYKSNKDFQEYVDRYTAKHGISTKDALEHSMVVEYAIYLIQERRV